MKPRLAMAVAPLLLLSLARSLAASDWPVTPQTRLENANVLPLALDQRYQFRKIQEFLNDPKYLKPTSDAMIAFERQRINWGAVTNVVDKYQRRGVYYNFFWRAGKPGPVTFRLEYQQANLGSYVQAREVHYNNPRGTMETQFQIIGDDYIQDGSVIAWRALLISDGKIVGLAQSYLWD
jgi:hypothetical protein